MNSVLLIKPGSMGDVIHALPVASAIRRAWPNTTLTWVVDPRWAPLLEGNSAVSVVKNFPRETFRGVAGWARAACWYGKLGGLRPDVVLDLQGLLRSALMARCSRGRTIYGLGDAREGAQIFYDHSADMHPIEHAVKRYLRILPLLGIDFPETYEFPLPTGVPSGLPDGYIVLHPFARGFRKSMPAEAIETFVSHFQMKNSAPVVIVGTGVAPKRLPENVMNLVGKTTLNDLLGILRRARFVVSVDSGPMHLAAALGIPTLGIHTWSNPQLVGPYCEDAWIWQGGEIRKQNLSCAPLSVQAFSVKSAAEVACFVAEQAVG